MWTLYLCNTDTPTLSYICVHIHRMYPKNVREIQVLCTVVILGDHNVTVTKHERLVITYSESNDRLENFVLDITHLNLN